MENLFHTLPSTFPVWTTLALGFVLGLRHALDADHVAAVATFAWEEKNLWRSSLIGAYWGAGHTAAKPACLYPHASSASARALSGTSCGS